jgi:hypothetical protein
MGIRDRDSCWKHFRELQILPLKSQYIYIYSLSLFVINNRYNFEMNTEVNNINTRNQGGFAPPITQLLVSQEGTYYAGIKVFNSLPAP